jgi:hypothetical protein
VATGAMNSVNEAVVIIVVVTVMAVVVEANERDKTGSLRTILTSIAGTVKKFGMIYITAEHMQESNKKTIIMMSTRTLALVLVLELVLGQIFNQALFLLINTPLIR